MTHDLPLLVVATTVCAYWTTVTLLATYMAVRHGRSAGILPRQRFERRLWWLVMPVVGAWIALPVLACFTTTPLLGLPSLAHDSVAWFAARALAAAIAVTCYLGSLYCWLLMGQRWSMAVVPGQSTGLVTEGIYRWVRHPIYAISVVLMVATAFVLPTPIMAVIAVLHLIGLNLKAGNEERHLTASFGPAYLDYCQHVGRFWPRLTSRRSA